MNKFFPDAELDQFVPGESICTDYAGVTEQERRETYARLEKEQAEWVAEELIRRAADAKMREES